MLFMIFQKMCKSAVWIQDRFYYTTPSGKVAYSIGGKVLKW